jgi:hypothetical protein
MKTTLAAAFVTFLSLAVAAEPIALAQVTVVNTSAGALQTGNCSVSSV